MKTAQQWIEELNLQSHPEGGYYKQTDKADELYEKNGRQLPLYTNITFLLTEDSPSHFHQLSSDELWFFHDGSPLTVHSLKEDGTYEQTCLGTNPSKNQQLNHTVSAGTIFGSTVETGYALVSCTVVPGFDFSEFKLFTKSELLKRYPKQATIINKLAYDQLPE